MSQVAVVMRSSLHAGARCPATFSRAEVGATRMGDAARPGTSARSTDSTAILEAMDRLQTISYDAHGRRSLERWPDGEGEGESFFDSDGVNLDRQVRIHAKVTKRGRALTIDFSGSAPQVPGPINLRPQGSEAASMIALLGYLDPNIAVNGGTQRAVTFVSPPGKVTNAIFPAPVNNYMPTLHLVLAAVQKALLAFDPPRASAPDGFGTGAMTIGYRGTHDRQTPRRAVHELFTPSLGASTTADSARSARCPSSTSTPSAPIEILESEFPVRDSCAASQKHRFRRTRPTARRARLRARVRVARRRDLHVTRGRASRSDSWGVAGGSAGDEGTAV